MVQRLASLILPWPPIVTLPLLFSRRTASVRGLAKCRRGFLSQSKSQIPPSSTVSVPSIARFGGEIIMVDNVEKANKAVMMLRQSYLLGFDTESSIPGFYGSNSAKENIPGDSNVKASINPSDQKIVILQIASDKVSAVIRLSDFSAKDFPKSLRELLEDRSVIKVGQAPYSECVELYKKFGLKWHSVVDLEYIARNTLKTSNWCWRPLTSEQLVYASTDAYVCRELLIKVWKNLIEQRMNGHRTSSTTHPSPSSDLMELLNNGDSSVVLKILADENAVLGDFINDHVVTRRDAVCRHCCFPKVYTHHDSWPHPQTPRQILQEILVSRNLEYEKLSFRVTQTRPEGYILSLHVPRYFIDRMSVPKEESMNSGEHSTSVSVSTADDDSKEEFVLTHTTPFVAQKDAIQTLSLKLLHHAWGCFNLSKKSEKLRPGMETSLGVPLSSVLPSPRLQGVISVLKKEQNKLWSVSCFDTPIVTNGVIGGAVHLTLKSGSRRKQFVQHWRSVSLPPPDSASMDDEDLVPTKAKAKHAVFSAACDILEREFFEKRREISEKVRPTRQSPFLTSK